MRDARRLFWHRAGPLAALAAVSFGAASQGCGGGGNESTGGGSGKGGSASTNTASGNPTSSSSSTNTSTAATSSGMGGMGGSTTTMSTTSSSSTASSTSTSSSGMTCAPATFGGAISPAANGGFHDAFDAQPNAMGTTVFFTGVDSMGNAGVFKQAICPAGTVTTVYTGPQFDAPFGIALSSDDKTVFVADPSAPEDPTYSDPTKDRGVLYSLSAAGGMAPSILVGSVKPRSVTVHVESGADQVYFTGIDKTTGSAGVFKIPAAGGAVSTVVEGAPFQDPGGIAIAKNGDIYVVDTLGTGSGLAAIILIPNGMTTGAAYLPNIQVGYPAGIAILSDASQLLVSGLDPTAQSDAIVQITVSSKAVTNVTTGIGSFSEAAGLHRALNADVFAWADTKATPMGMTGTGTVFVIQ
jgi:hypothetical protein